MSFRCQRLNSWSFVIRMLISAALWIVSYRVLVRGSFLQDKSHDVAFTLKARRFAPVFLILFAFTLTNLAFDWISSLEPLWYSDMFGVYLFAGTFLAGLSATAAGIGYLTERQRLPGVRFDHVYNLGGYLFAFTVFWSYIAFSQYMLIWYANIPEETTWFLRRQTGTWTGLSWFILVGHFIVPFLALISRIPKRRKRSLLAGALWIAFIHWVDMYYLVMPHTSAGEIPLHLLDLTCFLGIGGFFVAAFAIALEGGVGLALLLGIRRLWVLIPAAALTLFFLFTRAAPTT